MDTVAVARPGQTDRGQRRLVGTDLAALSLGISRRHMQRLVANGRVTNHGTTADVLIDLWELHDTLVPRVARKRYVA